MADHDAINQLAKALVDELAAASKAVATAESCSGGWIAKAITDVPGASEVFHYGIVSYSNGAKESLLGVKLETLESQGAVSEAIVEEMADGALHLSGADIAVAVSGVAGPTGGSEEKPVGMVWFAWAVKADDGVSVVQTACHEIDGDRQDVRVTAAEIALRGVVAVLEAEG